MKQYIWGALVVLCAIYFISGVIDAKNEADLTAGKELVCFLSEAAKVTNAFYREKGFYPEVENWANTVDGSIKIKCQNNYTIQNNKICDSQGSCYEYKKLNDNEVSIVRNTEKLPSIVRGLHGFLLKDGSDSDTKELRTKE